LRFNANEITFDKSLSLISLSDEIPSFQARLIVVSVLVRSLGERDFRAKYFLERNRLQNV
jgi:hypothetical protein